MLVDDGYLVLHDVITADLSRELASGIESALGVAPVTPESKVAFALGAYAQTPALWPLLDVEGLVAALAAAIGEPPVLLPVVDTLAVNGSETAPHRDSSYSSLASAAGPDDPRYRIIRMIAYPANEPSLTNDFYAVPGSHRPGWTASEDLGGLMRRIPLSGRDLVLFDARLVHAGGQVHGTKHMAVLTFGADNVLTWETSAHERRNRAEAGWSVDPPEDFIDALKQRDLLPERLL
jgi:hypothetical protein